MWEYSASENRFGTPEALMLLPYWTNRCIDPWRVCCSSRRPPRPTTHRPGGAVRRGRPSPRSVSRTAPVDVTLGVQHLQLLGVKYFMAETPQVEQEATVDPACKLVAKTGRGPTTTTGRDPHDVGDHGSKDSRW